MSSPPYNRCGYTWPKDHESGDDPNQQSCCWRETVSDEYDRCAWHAASSEITKSVRALQAVRESPEAREQNSPYAELLDGVDLSGLEIRNKIDFENVAMRDSTLSGAALPGANLSEATLRRTNLSDANLRNIDLSKADLLGADLSRAKLMIADLSETNLEQSRLSHAELLGAGLPDAVLRRADLSGAQLPTADLSGADLRFANLSGTNLVDVDLTDVDLRKATLSEDISVSGATNCRRLYEGYNAGIFSTSFPAPDPLRLYSGSDFDNRDWDSLARAYHDLKHVFSNHGMIAKARKMHVRERRARSREAKTSEGWHSTWRYLKSLPSQFVTGYGVQIRNLVFWMWALFLISTAVYVYIGVEDSFIENISYSVLAFTVAPPKIPTDVPFAVVVQSIMMIETFFGTLSIVLLGYILGNREQF